MKTVIIADDHPVFRNGLLDVLHEVGDIEILAEVADGIEAYTQIILQKPDLAILDIEMPGMSGLEVAKRIRNENYSTDFIIVTMHGEKHFFNEAMQIGIKGYILKDNAFNELMMCISCVNNGEKFISPGIEKQMIVTNSEPEIFWLTTLTATEKGVLKLIAENKTTNEICQLLFVSAAAAENYFSSIVKKSGIDDGQSLVEFAVQHKKFL